MLTLFSNHVEPSPRCHRCITAPGTIVLPLGEPAWFAQYLTPIYRCADCDREVKEYHDNRRHAP